MNSVLSFVITRHSHLPGVRLSLRGDRGNEPFDNDAAAVAECERRAKGRPYSIERKGFSGLRAYREV